ncbi:MAG TPA: hypothetical protein PLS69_09965 [Terricaulis sp.]|nr:hypothetical protein [Terricaulis sp.]HRP10159.1 hypothetical protein [Terricaulis sp.]
MDRPTKVSSTDFAGKFGQWSFRAQSAPVQVVNNKTGVTLGYFISEREFRELVRVMGGYNRKAVHPSELSPDLAAELEKPLAAYETEHDELVKD